MWKHREYLGKNRTRVQYSTNQSWKQALNRERFSWSLQKVMASVFETPTYWTFYGLAVSLAPIEVDTSPEGTRYGIEHSQSKGTFQPTFSQEQKSSFANYNIIKQQYFADAKAPILSVFDTGRNLTNGMLNIRSSTTQNIQRVEIQKTSVEFSRSLRWSGHTYRKKPLFCWHRKSSSQFMT